SPLVPHAHALAVAKALLLAVYVGVGLYIWARRPTSRLGPLLAGAGFLYTATALTAVDRSLPYTVGRVALAVLIVYFAYLFVSFPRGRLQSAVERRFVLAVGGLSAVLWALLLVFAQQLPHGGPLSDCTADCPDNALQLVSTSHEVTRVLGLASSY